MTICSRYAKSICVVLATLATVNAIADVTQTTSTETELTIDATVLSEADQKRAAAWELNDVEWHRYDTLLKGIRGSVSPTSLSPIEVLGIHAQDAAERRHYAERWARAMREDAERILAFQHAYDAAFKRIFGDEDIVDVARLAGRTPQEADLQSGDRLLFFSATDCPPCDAVFAKVLSHIDSIDGVDIYFNGEAKLSAKDIRHWAEQQRIDAQWVRSRRVTLNLDDSVLHSIDPDAGEPPLLFVRRNGTLHSLSYADL